MPPSTPVEVLSATIWGEARGTSPAGMRHVASVVVNRVKNPRWWGHDIISVCKAPWQFSCWNCDDPNFPKLISLRVEDPLYSTALKIADTAISGKLVDETGGADSYYAKSMKKAPSWTVRAVHTYSDEWHSFWRVELPAPSGHPDSPNVSHVSSDALNDAELHRIQAEKK